MYTINENIVMDVSIKNRSIELINLSDGDIIELSYDEIKKTMQALNQFIKVINHVNPLPTVDTESTE